MDDNEFGGNRFLFGGNQNDDNDHLSNSDSDTDDSAESSVFRTFMGGSGDGPRLFGSGDSSANSSEPSISPDSVPHLNYKPEDLEFDEAYPLVLDKPIFKRFEPETDEVSSQQPEETQPSVPEQETVEPFYPDAAYPQPEDKEPSMPEPDYTQTEEPVPSMPEPDYTQTEEPVPSIPEPDYTQTEEPVPSIPEPDYTQTEEPVPSIPEPDYTQPAEAVPSMAEPDYTQTEEPVPSIPEPDYTQTEEPAPYYPESDYTQTEEPAYDSDVSNNADNVAEPVYANESDYSENIPYAETSDDASSYDSIDNSFKSPQRTDEFADDEDEMSDTAFPLFLSFKANDSAASVSEAIREKNSQKTTDTASRSLSGKESAPKTPVDEKSYNRMMNEAEPQIFKPYETPEESKEVYDIPSVQPQNAVSGKNAATETAAVKPFFKPQETRPASASRPIEKNPGVSEAADDSDPNKTVRPGTRYYPAAQQMGYAAPMPQRELNTKRRKKKHGPLIFTLTAAAVLVAAFFIWNKYDIGTWLAIGNSNPAATTTASVTNETSASTVSAAAASVPTVTVSPKPVKVTDTPAAVVSVTAVPTGKATATPTPKATATPTPKATATPTPKATATPTPKATATPTPKATATPTPASGESAKTPSGFSTSITDGSAKGDTALFNILFKNLSKTDVSLFDGVEYITITFSTEGAPITSVASDSFTFTLDPKHANTFIGIPTDKEVIAKKDTKTVGITGVTDGKNVGKYSIKYYVKTY